MKARRFSYAFSSLLFLYTLGAAAQRQGTLIAISLQCEDKTTPLGIDNPQPLLRWVVQSTDRKTRNRFATGFQIQVATTLQKLQQNRPDLWDVQKEGMGINTQLTYNGNRLQSEKTYYWRVRMWDETKQVSAWSTVGSWTMGLLQQQDWKGTWISDSKPLPAEDSLLYVEHPAPLFRKEFSSSRKVAKAFLHVTGLGYHEVYLNGQKIGDHVLEPAWTDYSKRVLYSTYDVSQAIRQGVNALGIWLGNGWYNPLPQRMWARLNLRRHLPVGKPTFLLQLNIIYADGSRQSVISDNSWEAGDSYILKNNLYLGELHDMQKKEPRWCRAGFNDSHWRSVLPNEGPGGLLYAQPMSPVRITNQLPAVQITRLGEKKHIVDFGKNFAGVVRIIAKGKKGERISVRYGELLYDDGTLNVMTSVAGQIKQKGVGGPGAPDIAYRKDEFILSSRQDTFQPRFSYTGFRFVEVTGMTSLALQNIVGLQLHTAVDRAGDFWCCDPLITKIYQASVNTFVSNLHGVQSDCPHRERFGYGGDIAITAPSLLLTFSMYNFYKKTLADFLDAQRKDGAFTETAPFVGISDEGLTPEAGPVGWGYAVPVLMESLFRYYGDTAIIRNNYEGLKRWVNYLEQHAKNFIIDKGISDHESIDPKPVALTGTAFFYRSAKKLSEFASLMGKRDDANHYHQLSESIKAAFLQTFLQTESGKFSIGTQAAQSFAFQYRLVPDSLSSKALSWLMEQVRQKDFHVATGMFGTLYMLQTLSEFGHQQAAWRIVTQKTFPGWGYMIENGATTIWEHWAFSDNTFSHNHPMWGSVTEWFIRYLAGISPAENAIGFNDIQIKPYGLQQVDSLNASYRSVKGNLDIRWHKANGRADIYIAVPLNATATISLPAAETETLWLDNLPVDKHSDLQFVERNNGWVVMRAGSGVYHFVVVQEINRKSSK